MAIARITTQDANGTGASPTLTVNYPGATTAGNWLFACVTANVNTATDYTPTGWTLAVSYNTTSVTTRIYYKIADGTETGCTWTIGGGYTIYMHIYEYSGISARASLDILTYTEAKASATNGFIMYNKTLSNSDNALLLGAAGLSTNVTSPVWTVANERQTTARLLTADKVLTAKGTYQALASWTTSANFVGVGIIIRQDPAHSYTWYEAPAPANVVVTPIAGGTLPASTTYYYRIFAVAMSNGQYYYSDSWMSPPCAEISATTDATNKKMHIYFDVVSSPATAGSYGGYRSTVSGDYYVKNAGGTVKNNIAPLLGSVSSLFYTVPTTSTNYKQCRTMTFDIGVASLSIGETLTQATSGATCVVATNPAGGTTCQVNTITGTWSTSAYTITGSVTGSLGVTKYVSCPTTITGGVVYDDGTMPSGYLKTPWLPNGLPTLKIQGGDEQEPHTPHTIYDWLVANSHDSFIDVWGGYEAGDWQEIFASGVARDVGAAYCWRFNLITANSGIVTYYKQTGNTFVLHKQGKFYPGQQGDVVQWGEYNPTTLTTSNGAPFVGIKSYAHYNGLPNTRMYDSYISGAFKPYTYTNPYGITPTSVGNSDNYFQFLGASDVTLYNSHIKNTGRMNIKNYDFKNTRLATAGMELSSIGATTIIDKCAGDCSINTGNGIGEVYCPNFVFKPHPSYPYFTQPMAVPASNKIYTTFMHFIDPEHYSSTPQVYHNCVGGSSTNYNWDCLVLESTFLKIKVTDTLGNPLAGVTVTLTDKNGVTQLIQPTSPIVYDVTQDGTKTQTTLTFFSEMPTIGSIYRRGLERITIDSLVSGATYNVTRGVHGSAANNGVYSTSSAMSFLRLYKVNETLNTDSNGMIEIYPEIRTWTDYNNITSNSGNITASKVELNPYTLTLRKDGYETYTQTITITEKTNPTITLKAQITKLEDDNGNVFDRVDKTNSGTTNLRRKIVKV